MGREAPLRRLLGAPLLLYVVTLWGAFTATFIFFRLTPGDPINAMIQEMARQGQILRRATEEMVVYYKKVSASMAASGSSITATWNH